MEEKAFKNLLENCRLELSQAEAEAVRRDVEEIISYFNNLDGVDCSGLEPAYHPVKIPGVFREDIPEEFDDKKAMLDNTKTHRFFVVGPKV